MPHLTFIWILTTVFEWKYHGNDSFGMEWPLQRLNFFRRWHLKKPFQILKWGDFFLFRIYYKWNCYWFQDDCWKSSLFLTFSFFLRKYTYWNRKKVEIKEEDVQKTDFSCNKILLCHNTDTEIEDLTTVYLFSLHIIPFTNICVPSWYSPTNWSKWDRRIFSLFIYSDNKFYQLNEDNFGWIVYKFMNVFIFLWFSVSRLTKTQTCNHFRMIKLIELSIFAYTSWK